MHAILTGRIKEAVTDLPEGWRLKRSSLFGTRDDGGPFRIVSADDPHALDGMRLKSWEANPSLSFHRDAEKLIVMAKLRTQ